MSSPYAGLSVSQWQQHTLDLIEAHPLDLAEVVKIVNLAWAAIFESMIGSKPFRIGADIFPKPQIMGFFLHELIPLELSQRHPGIWRGEANASEKDLVYIPDTHYSVEIKTSSSSKSIFGNRSYAQEAIGSKKSKAGYYLTVNFEKFAPAKRPKITQVRFGWLDHTDWRGQAAATGQQASLSPDADRYKLIALPLE